MPHPDTIGPYELVRPLGVGGMAETFLALRRGPAGFEQRVCLKRILPAYTAEPKFVELFLDEARLLAQMHSASIVQVFDFGEADGSFYMALELVEGTDLETLLRACARDNTRLPIPVALYIAAQLLSALDYAHTLAVDGQPLHIVHRDISPSNVLLSRHGEVKLTDFGIARSRQRRHKTNPGHTKGKLAYMCPEQVRGEALDARSNLFSVGVVLYEMLAGAHPHATGSELELVNRILSGQRPNLRALVPEISLETKQLVDRLLGATPAARPDGAREALKLLPLKEQPFLVQRRLAELVRLHCREPAAVCFAPPASAQRATAPSTAPLRATASAPPVAAAQTVADKRRPAPRAPDPPHRFGGVLVASVVSLSAASTLLAWPPLNAAQPSQSSPQAAPTAALSLPRLAAASSEDSALHARRGASASTHALPDADDPRGADRVAAVKPGRTRHSLTPPDAPPSSRASRREVVAPSPIHAKSRSGLSVHADEF